MISEAQEQDGKGDNMNSDMISISALTAVITALLPAFKIFSSYDKRIALLEHQTMALLVKQEKAISFYESNYPISNPIAGFIDSDFILFFGLNHVYSTFWFLR